jgi:hypothetical protein
VAARIRRELKTDVEMIHGHYGEFKVLVGDQIVADVNKLGFPPPPRKVLAEVRTRLALEPAKGQNEVGINES